MTSFFARAAAVAGAAVIAAGAGLVTAPGASAAVSSGWAPAVPLHMRADAWKVAPLDKRCKTGRALCADKTSRTLRWVVDGKIRMHMDARFGAASMPTREGQFAVAWKSRDHVSSLYNTPMPYAMFFSGGQAVHYSPDFAAVGYDGASHGCVNTRDLKKISALFDLVKVGDKVVVYRS
jgi:hypothetical protein